MSYLAKSHSPVGYTHSRKLLGLKWLSSASYIQYWQKTVKQLIYANLTKGSECSQAPLTFNFYFILLRC